MIEASKFYMSQYRVDSNFARCSAAFSPANGRKHRREYANTETAYNVKNQTIKLREILVRFVENVAQSRNARNHQRCERDM